MTLCYIYHLNVLLWLLSVVQVDGMDNSKSYLPRFLEKTKANQGTERLPTKISGCIVYSGYYEHKRKILFYINHDQVLLCILILYPDFFPQKKMNFFLNK